MGGYKSKFTGKQIDKILDFMNVQFGIISNEIRGTIHNTTVETTFKLNSSEIITPEVIDKNFSYKIPEETIVTSIANMFSQNKNVVSIDLSDFDMSAITDINNAFNNCTLLTSLEFNPVPIKLQKIYAAFYLCSGLTTINVSNFDTSSVTSFSSVFSGCSKLKSVDLSNFDTSSATTMITLFSNCIALESLDLSNFDTSLVTNMKQMFSYCKALKSLDLSNFDTSLVTDMTQMFSNCIALESLDLSNFDVSKIKNFSNMFSNCLALNYIKCKQTFKDWCIANQTSLVLPSAMKEDGSGVWDIV